VVAREPGSFCIKSFPAGVEIERVLPTIVGIWAALDVPAVLEIVHERDDPASAAVGVGC